MLALALIFGAAVGLALGLTGGGGSIIAVPLLVYGLAMAPRQAVGVSLAAVGTTALVGAVHRLWHGEVEARTGLIFAVAGMLGAPVGAFVGHRVPEVVLLLAFAVLMLWVDTTRIDGLRDFVKHLRASERPDLVVGVSHMGLTVTRQMAREIPEFDVILSGHTHERTEKAILEGHVIVVEAGSMGSFLGRLDLTLKPGGGVASHDFRLIPITAEAYPEDAKVKGIVDEALRPHRARLNEVVGRTETPILRYDVLETSADNLIAEVVREAAGADMGFTNGFRFGLPILAGNVTVGDLWNLLPLDARMKVGRVTGRQLREYLENELELVYSKDPWKLSGGWGPRASGMSMTYAAKAPPGKRLISLKVNGQEVEDDRLYTMAGCERDGEPMDVICRLRGAREARMLPETIHAALLKYFESHPVVAPQRDGRAIAVDLPSKILSLDETLSART